MSLVVVSFGGGTNSAALIILRVLRGERIDMILFADTGGERPETYAFINIFSKWLVSKGYPPVTIVKSNKTLEQDCLDRKTLPSLAFGFKTCSQRFKIQPQDKFLNNWDSAKKIWKSGEKVIKLIGYDAGEPHRVKDYDSKKFICQYPLVDENIWRGDCEEIIKKAGLPQPGKSSCFFCPSMKKHEILELRKKNPELLQRAIDMEKNAELTDIPGLGRSYAWSYFIEYTEYMEKEQANARPGEKALGNGKYQCSMFTDMNDDMPCGCYDG